MDDINLLFDDESIKSLNKLIKEGKITKKVLSNLEFLIPQANANRKRNKS